MKIFYTISCVVLSLFVILSAFAGLGYNDISGKWRLMYKNNCGYEFRFQNNYRAFCIVYSGTSALVFKGIYSIEGDRLTININEMKNEENARRLDLGRKFVKASSSYFVFKAELAGKEKNKILVLKSVKTIIDGNDSNGYFEPEISLKRF